MEWEDRIQSNPRLLRLKNPITGEIIDYEIQDLNSTEIIKEGTEVNAENLYKITPAISPTEPTNGQLVWIKKHNNIFDLSTATKIESANIETNGNIMTDTSSTYDLYYITCEANTKYKISTESTESIVITSLSEVPAIGKQGQAREVGTKEMYYTTASNDSYLVVRDKKQRELTDLDIRKAEKKIYVKNDEGEFEEFINVDEISKGYSLVYKEYETTTQSIETESDINNLSGEITTNGGDVLVDISFFATIASGTAFLNLNIDGASTSVRIGALSRTDTNALYNFKYIIKNLSKGTHTVTPKITLNSGATVTMSAYQSKYMLLQEL